MKKVIGHSVPRRSRIGPTGRNYLVGLTVTCLVAVGSTSAAQQTGKILRVGCLAPVFPCAASVASFKAFRNGLTELGYTDGLNINIECRSAAGDAQRLVGLASELIQLKADVVVAAGGELVARAAQKASHTILSS